MKKGSNSRREKKGGRGKETGLERERKKGIEDIKTKKKEQRRKEK